MASPKVWESKKSKTVTSALRNAYKIYPVLEPLVGDQKRDVMILGAGYDEQLDFVPEFLELTVMFSRTPVDFVVVDHSEIVIKSVQTNFIYHCPNLTDSEVDYEQKQNALQIILNNSCVHGMKKKDLLTQPK